MSTLRQQDSANKIWFERNKLLSEVSNRRQTPRGPRPLTSPERRLAPHPRRARKPHEGLSRLRLVEFVTPDVEYSVQARAVVFEGDLGAELEKLFLGKFFP